MTYTWFASRFSSPEMWIRQGLTLARTRPSLRNHRPVRNRRGSRSNSRIAPSSGTQSTMRVAVAAQIQAERSRRAILSYSTVQILALSAAGSNLSPLGSITTPRRLPGLNCFGGQSLCVAFPVGQTGYSQPIPKAGIGGSPRFAARTLIGIFERVPGLRHHPGRHFTLPPPARLRIPANGSYSRIGKALHDRAHRAGPQAEKDDRVSRRDGRARAGGGGSPGARRRGQTRAARRQAGERARGRGVCRSGKLAARSEGHTSE